MVCHINKISESVHFSEVFPLILDTEYGKGCSWAWGNSSILRARCAYTCLVERLCDGVVSLAVLRSGVPFHAIVCCGVVYCVVSALRCVALRCVALRCVALRCVVLRCVVLCCVVLCCVVLCCAVLCCVWCGVVW